jgi:cytoskeleton protein RodZ
MSTSEESIVVESPVEPLAETIAPLSIGNRLREARLSKGLTIADVADGIKFSQRQVEALEADDFTHLPERAFVRGFIRSYARLLQIDPTDLLEVLPLERHKLAEVADDLAVVKNSSLLSIRHKSQLWAVAGIGLILIISIAAWLMRPSPVPQPLVNELILPEITLPISAVDQTSAVLASSSILATSSVASAVVAISAPLAVSAVAPSLSPVASAVTVVPAAKSGPIRLLFKVDSWTEIKDKNGNTVFKKIGLAGSEQWVNGQAPFSLVIGNAAGVRLYYQGEEVKLEEFTDISTAHLILE